MSEWISVKDKEAPKDGTHFLCYDPDHPYARIYVVRFENETNILKSGYVEAAGEMFFEWKPTHWMPLPEGPKDA